MTPLAFINTRADTEKSSTKTINLYENYTNTPKKLNLTHKNPIKPPQITRKIKAPALVVFAMETIGEKR
jgi:hypothetical protein